MGLNSATPLQSGAIVIACASFKGTLSSRLAGDALARGLQRAGFQALVVTLADGGEGLVEALVSQVPGARYIDTVCRAPLLDKVTARLAIIGPNDDATAVIEMAASSGLSLVPESNRDPNITTTLGVGDQILAALDLPGVKVTRLLIGIGGSATNDGGAGMAQALGARLLDANGHDLPPGGAALNRLSRIDVSGIDQRLANLRVTVACDVQNPLCGPTGASIVFGPQKGASSDDIEKLDIALGHYAAIIERDVGANVLHEPGAGAAGGLGAGLLAFLHAKLEPGIDLLLDAIDFDSMLNDAALVLTGEGRLDAQTLMGKAPLGVARRAAHKNIPCIAVGGDIEFATVDVFRSIFARIESLREFAGSVEAAKADAAGHLEALALAKAPEWWRFASKRRSI